jgi:hypothetical protein
MKSRKNRLYSFFALGTALVVMLIVVIKLWHSSVQTNHIVSEAPEQPTDQSKSITKSKPETQNGLAAVSRDSVEQEVLMTEAVKEQMKDIALAYESNMRFPTYSKPLNANDWNLLNPRPFVEKKAPLQFNENISASIVLEQYIAHRDKPLNVEVHVSGTSAQNIEVVKVITSFANASYTTNDPSPIPLTKTSVSGEKKDVQIFRGTMPVSYLEGLPANENMVLATLSFSNNEEATVTAAFKLADTDATLTRVDEAYIDGAHLMVPVTLDVNVEGHYRIQANLFDKASKQPISHINAAFRLDQFENSGLLKVHATTLRNKGFSGPYTLKDINITRSPSEPGDRTGYGSTSQESYSINGFDLAYYDDQEYQDPKAQRRLEFLQRLAESP